MNVAVLEIVINCVFGEKFRLLQGLKFNSQYIVVYRTRKLCYSKDDRAMRAI